MGAGEWRSDWRLKIQEQRTEYDQHYQEDTTAESDTIY